MRSRMALVTFLVGFVAVLLARRFLGDAPLAFALAAAVLLLSLYAAANPARIREPGREWKLWTGTLLGMAAMVLPFGLMIPRSQRTAFVGLLLTAAAAAVITGLRLRARGRRAGHAQPAA